MDVDNYEQWKAHTKNQIYAATFAQLCIKFSVAPSKGHHRQPWPMGKDLAEIDRKAVALAELWENSTAP